MPILDPHGKLNKKKKAPTPQVAGASISTTKRPPAARGDDFAGGFNEIGGLDIVRDTGASISDIITASNRGGGISRSDLRRIANRQAQQRRLEINRARRQNKKKQQQQGAIGSETGSARISSETQATSISSGARSSRTPLTDKEVDELGGQGFFEGDTVPGRGVLLPDGTFDDTEISGNSDSAELLDRIEARLLQLKDQDQTSAAGAVSSDTPIVNEEKAAVESLSEPSPVTKDALNLLDQQSDILQKQLQAEVQSITNSFNRQESATKDAQAREAGATSVGLASAGGYLGFSGSGTGVMLSLTRSHRAELQDLELRRQQAISQAKQAAASRQFDLVREKAEEVARIDQETYERQSAYNKEIKAAADKQKAEAAKQQTQQSIMTAIQNGSKTPEAIFEALGGNTDMDEIAKFLKNIGTTDEEGFEFSPSHTAALLGSGLSVDDIKAFNEYVNSNGYDETVRSSLSPSQRKTADKIFRSHLMGAGNASGFSKEKLEKLEQAGLLNAPRQEQLDFLYGEKPDPFKSVYTPQILNGEATLDGLPIEVQKEQKAELFELGFGSDVVPQWYQDGLEEESQMSVDPEVLKESWTSYRKKALGEEEVVDDEGGGVVNWIKNWGVWD